MDEKNIDYIIEKYPNRIPVILNQTERFLRLHKLKKHKYLIHSETKVGLFLFQLKKINNIKTADSMFLLHNDTVINSGDTFGFLQVKFNNEKALILTVDVESAFG